MFQKMGEAMELTTDDLVQTYMLMNNLNYQPNSPEYNSLANELGNNIKDEFLRRNFDEIVDRFLIQAQPELESALTALAGHTTLDYSRTKNHVLLIPHSQGNLYANNLYDYLTTIEHYNPHQIQIFGIATPGSQLKGNQILSTFINLINQNPHLA